jgi:hypothetical protein
LGATAVSAADEQVEEEEGPRMYFIALLPWVEDRTPLLVLLLL